MNNKIARLLSIRGLLNLNIGWIIVGLSFIAAFVFGDYDSLPKNSTYEVKGAWIQLAALAISTGISVFKGIQQKKAANKLEQGNVRPDFKISRGTLHNLALAKQSANEGLTAQTYRNAIEGLGTGVSAAMRNNLLYGRGNSNTASLVRTYNEGLNQVNEADEQARVRNRGVLMEANQNLANEEREAFKVANQNFKDTADRVSELRSAGDANIFDAAGNVLKGVASGSILGGKTASTKLTNPIDAMKNNVSFSNIAIGKTPSVNPFLNLKGSSFFNIGGVN